MWFQVKSTVSIFAGVRTSWHKYAQLPLFKLRPIVWIQYTLHPGLQGVDRETDAVFIQLPAWGVFRGTEDNEEALFWKPELGHSEVLERDTMPKIFLISADHSAKYVWRNFW